MILRIDLFKLNGPQNSGIIFNKSKRGVVIIFSISSTDRPALFCDCEIGKDTKRQSRGGVSKNDVKFAFQANNRVPNTACEFKERGRAHHRVVPQREKICSSFFLAPIVRQCTFYQRETYNHDQTTNKSDNTKKSKPSQALFTMMPAQPCE